MINPGAVMVQTPKVEASNRQKWLDLQVQGFLTAGCQGNWVCLNLYRVLFAVR